MKTNLSQPAQIPSISTVMYQINPLNLPEYVDYQEVEKLV